MEKTFIEPHKLWLKGLDIDNDAVLEAIRHNKLLHLDIDLTAKCGLNCFYCDRTPDRFCTKNRKEITFAEKKEIISHAKLLGARTVEVPGAGEPLQDEYFWDTINHVDKLDMIPVVFSSGYHLDKKSIDKLYSSNVSICLKKNHIDQTIQDEIVNFSGYGAKANEVFQLLQDRGFNKVNPTRLAINMVLTPQYYDSNMLKMIFRYCRKNNIHFCIGSLIPEGNANNARMHLSRWDIDKIIEEFRLIDETEFNIKYAPIRPLLGGYRCNQVNIGVHINLYGEVYDCNGLGRFLGHIKRNTLEEIWNSKYAKFIRREFQNGYCLPRERVWDGIKEQGISRKISHYLNWKFENGLDKIVEYGLEYMGQKI